MAEISKAAGPRNTGRHRPAPDRRQLCDAQTRECEGVAAKASAVSPSLHPDREFMAESDRALLCRPYAGCDSGRKLHKRAATDRRHRRIPRTAQSGAETLSVESEG